MIKKNSLLTLLMGASSLVYSQTNIRPVLTGAPFLRVAPDARSGGLGDQGVATTPDAFSQYWNASKYIFGDHTSSVAFNYTPYMQNLTNDIFLLYAGYNVFLGDEERSSLSASLYYFNMGKVDLSRLVGTQVVDEGVTTPNEFAIDLAYALKLSDYYSMAITGRFIRSDLGGGFNSDNTLKPANTFAVDVSGYFQSEKFSSFGNYEGRLRSGFNVSNIGPKLDYTGNEESRSYLPTMFRLGVGYDLFLDDQNRLGLTTEVSKILVPSAEFTGTDANDLPIYTIPNVGVISGMGKSFSSEGGLAKTLMYSGSLEYSYDNAFAIRTGYFHEDDTQGARKFATLGVGLKYDSFGLDISYLINTSKINSALDNTLRFGLTWNIGEESSNRD